MSWQRLGGLKGLRDIVTRTQNNCKVPLLGCEVRQGFRRKQKCPPKRAYRIKSFGI
jgi:hypothetical protein